MSWKSKLPHLEAGLSIKDPMLRETINELIDRDMEELVAGPGIHLDDNVISAWPGGGVAQQTIQRMRIKNVFANYLVCHTWDGSTEGGDNILVAKPFKLRHVLANYNTLTGLVTLSPVSVQAISTTVVGAGTVTVTETWQVTPNYEHNDEILAVSGHLGGTGVTYGGDELLWIELNENARAWAMDCPA